MTRNCSHTSWPREIGAALLASRPAGKGARYAWPGLAGGTGLGLEGGGIMKEGEGALKKRQRAASGSQAAPRRRALVTAVMVVSVMPCHGARVYGFATREPLSRATVWMRD